MPLLIQVLCNILISWSALDTGSDCSDQYIPSPQQRDWWREELPIQSQGDANRPQLSKQGDFAGCKQPLMEPWWNLPRCKGLAANSQQSCALVSASPQQRELYYLHQRVCVCKNWVNPCKAVRRVPCTEFTKYYLLLQMWLPHCQLWFVQEFLFFIIEDCINRCRSLKDGREFASFFSSLKWYRKASHGIWRKGLAQVA